MLIKLSAGDATMQSLLARQTPGSSLRWGDKTFFFGEEHDHCDWWFVLHADGLRHAETVRCDPGHTVLITMEPPDWGRPARFYRQFARIVSCDPRLRHPCRLPRNGITWWAGINVAFDNGHVFSPSINQDFDGFQAMPIPVKQNRISIITSPNKSFPGHAKRLRFIERLRTHLLAQHIDFYGGCHPIADKLDGLLKYKYHIAIENSILPEYWTEKIADAFLAYALPIYAGCPNIDSYFPADSFLSINLDDFDGAVKKIDRCLREDEYASRFDAIAEARRMVLIDYNIFALMAKICDRPAERLVPCALRPRSELEFRKPAWLRHVAARIKKVRFIALR